MLFNKINKINKINFINDDCSICLTNIKKSSNTLSCNHTFHKDCIDEWLKNNSTCPNCRTTVKIIEKTVPTPIITPNIIINIPITVINNNQNTTQKNIIKYILLSLYILVILFHACSSVYYYYQSQKINNNINNYIKTLNDTELGDHNHNTYESWILITSDIVYYFMFIITNIIIFKDVNDCCCSKLGAIFVLVGITIANFIIHLQFNGNTNSYLSDKELNFDVSYSKDLDLAILLYFCSYVSELCITASIFGYRKMF